MNTFEKESLKLQKKYDIPEVHVGCFLCNFGDKYICHETCKGYDKCKQIQEEMYSEKGGTI